MNWNQLKDSVSHMWLAGVVTVSFFLTQGVAGSNPFTAITIFSTEIALRANVITCLPPVCTLLNDVLRNLGGLENGGVSECYTGFHDNEKKSSATKTFFWIRIQDIWG